MKDKLLKELQGRRDRDEWKQTRSHLGTDWLMLCDAKDGEDDYGDMILLMKVVFSKVMLMMVAITRAASPGQW